MDDSQRAQAESRARMMFREIDADADGQLTVQEILDYSIKNTRSYEPFAVDKMFGSIIAADADKNHSVSEEEFVRHYVESQA
ncbi:EF-hand domain-containing protein [Streptomyces sp. NPDC090046]|uniref:EF-hand domain-containing protein n=1 Tax=Streptomyces sp. NPDC090046 TaxID=3365928 RepID=UPI0037F522F9